MEPIEYLKLQAKNLYRDFKTQTSSFDPKMQRNLYDYDAKFFKIDLLIDDFNINEEKFKLGNAQHVIAKLCGLEKWSDLLKASPAKIELSILLYNNMDRLEVRDWDNYISDIETENNVKLDDEFKLQIFKEAFISGEQYVYYDDYRLSKDEETEIDWEVVDPVSKASTEQIYSLPLCKEDREEFIEVANLSFERVFERIEPENPEQVRKMYDADEYINKVVLTPNHLPIDRDYALSLVEAFMVGYAIQLAVEADNQAEGLI